MSRVGVDIGRLSMPISAQRHAVADRRGSGAVYRGSDCGWLSSEEIGPQASPGALPVSGHHQSDQGNAPARSWGLLDQLCNELTAERRADQEVVGPGEDGEVGMVVVQHLHDQSGRLPSLRVAPHEVHHIEHRSSVG